MKSFAWPLAMALFAAGSLPAAEFHYVTCAGS